MLEEFNESINACVQVQKRRKLEVLDLVHLEAQKHQLARYMKGKTCRFSLVTAVAI